MQTYIFNDFIEAWFIQKIHTYFFKSTVKYDIIFITTVIDTPRLLHLNLDMRNPGMMYQWKQMDATLYISRIHSGP